jgi:predicted nucleotidyltransferase
MVTNLSTIKDLLINIMSENDMNIVHASLFGSRVYGTSSLDSDYDIIVITDIYNPNLQINNESNTIDLYGLEF